MDEKVRNPTLRKVVQSHDILYKVSLDVRYSRN